MSYKNHDAPTYTSFILISKYFYTKNAYLCDKKSSFKNYHYSFIHFFFPFICLGCLPLACRPPLPFLPDAFIFRVSFLSLGSTTLNRPLTPDGRDTRLPAPFFATTYVVSVFFCLVALLYMLKIHNVT